MRRLGHALTLASAAAALFAVAGCGDGVRPLPDAAVVVDAPLPDAAAAAPADARSFGDARPLPDGAAPGACEAEVSGPTAPLALADRAVTESRLVVPDRGLGPVRRVELVIDLAHPYPRDLLLELRSPAGTIVRLSGRRGTGDGYRNTRFTDEAATPIALATGSMSGAFRPEEPLAALKGGPVAGEWALRMTDLAAGDTGVLFRWTLRADACTERACVTSTTRSAPEIFGGPSRPIYLPIAADPYVTVVAARAGVSVEYPFAGDLRLRLWSPRGTAVLLSSGNGGLGADYLDTVFDDLAELSIVDGAAPFTGRFRPEEPLAAVAGEPARGTWVTSIDAPTPEPENGFVKSWSLELDVCDLPCPAGSLPHRYAIPGPVEPAAAVTIQVLDVGVVAAAAVRASVTNPGAVPLRLLLRPPSGGPVALVDGGVSGDLTGTLFVDQAARTVVVGEPPFSGAFRPAQALGSLEGGAALGAWRIEATSDAGGVLALGDVELEVCLGAP